MHLSLKNKYNRINYYIQNGINPTFPTVTAEKFNSRNIKMPKTMLIEVN